MAGRKYNQRLNQWIMLIIIDIFQYLYELVINNYLGIN